jgi:RNA polymerase sigma factor (sigma-70 family)
MNTTARLQELLDQLHAGQEPARDALLEQSLDRVRLLAQRMFRRQNDLRRQAETDDVVSKAMLRLHRALAQVRPPNVRAFYGLAATHIRFVLRDLVREKAADQRVTFLAEPGDPPTTTDEPSDLAQWSEFHERIAALPDEQRELFDLLFYQGLEQAEAAELLGMPLRTLKRKWQHARLALRGEDRP